MTSYPFDPSGTQLSNLITDEVHQVSFINRVMFRVLIPKYSPFFANGVIVKHRDQQGNITILTQDVDYNESLLFLGATRSIGIPIYGAIVFINENISGDILISYRTLGGKWVADRNYVYQFLASKKYNPRTVVWDQVTNVQDVFPPINHQLDLDNIKGYDVLVDAINNISNAILNRLNPTEPLIDQLHREDFTNPHRVTKAQVGLPDIVNLPLASDEEVVNHDNVDKYITLRQLNIVLTTIHEFLNNYTGNISAEQITSGIIDALRLPLASITEKGIVQLNDSLDSTSITEAATANSVKQLKDLIDHLSNNSSFSNKTEFQYATITSNVVTTGHTTQTVIDELDIDTARTIRYVMQIKYVNRIHSCELTIVHNGIISNIVEKDNVYTHDFLAEFSTYIADGKVKLIAIPVYNGTQFTYLRTAITPENYIVPSYDDTIEYNFSNISTFDYTAINALEQVLDSVDIRTTRTVKYLIQISNDNNYHVCELFVIHDGDNSYITEKVNLSTREYLCEFDSYIEDDSIYLLITPNYPNTNFKVIKTTVLL